MVKSSLQMQKQKHIRPWFFVILDVDCGFKRDSINNLRYFPRQNFIMKLSTKYEFACWPKFITLEFCGKKGILNFSEKKNKSKLTPISLCNFQEKIQFFALNLTKKTTLNNREQNHNRRISSILRQNWATLKFWRGNQFVSI